MTGIKSLGLAAALIGLMVSGDVAAQDKLVEKGDWLVRTRGLLIVPDESSTVSIGGEVDIDPAFTPELDFTYFWTDNFATELILATNRHTAIATGTALGDLTVGSVNLLPPTLLAQYHFPVNDTVKPYLGAGINYTFFYNEEGADVPIDSFENGFGFALQAGVDIFVTDTVFINLDAKRLWLDTEVSLANGAATADIDINPWIFGAGIGFKF